MVAGGANSAGWPRNAELYDSGAGRWRRAGTMTTGRERATATLLGNGRVLLAGGANPSGLLFRLALQSGLEQLERDRQHECPAHWQLAAILQDGRVLVAGGDTADAYSPATGTWTATGPMVYPYASAGAALLPSGQVLYMGGRRVKYCGQYSCDEPLPDAALYAP